MKKTGLLDVFIRNVIFWDFKSGLVSTVYMSELITNIATDHLIFI